MTDILIYERMCRTCLTAVPSCKEFSKIVSYVVFMASYTLLYYCSFHGQFTLVEYTV